MPTELAGIAVVPLIVGLVEVAKRLGLEARWAPPLALILGLAISLGSLFVGGCRLEGTPQPATCNTLVEALLVGVALGLSAAGLYSGAKKAMGHEP